MDTDTEKGQPMQPDAHAFVASDYLGNLCKMCGWIEAQPWHNAAANKGQPMSEKIILTAPDLGSVTTTETFTGEGMVLMPAAAHKGHRHEPCAHENRQWDEDAADGMGYEVCTDCGFCPDEEQRFYGFWPGWEAGRRYEAGLRDGSVQDAK